MKEEIFKPGSGDTPVSLVSPAPDPSADCIGCGMLSMMLGELAGELGTAGSHPAMVAEIRRLKAQPIPPEAGTK